MLHYTYNRFEDLKSRRDRCDCAPTEDDAKRCFILPFDRSVSLAFLLSAVWQVFFCVTNVEWISWSKVSCKWGRLPRCVHAFGAWL